MDPTADRGPIVIGVVSFLWILTIIAISLRVISRYLAKVKWWWDDYLAVTAWALYSVKAISTIYTASPEVGGGRHGQMVSFDQVMEFVKMEIMQFAVYPVAMGAAKCSVILFYIRIFGVQRWFRRWCYVLLGLVIGWSISICLVTIFSCIPVASTWDPTISNKKCIDQPTFFNLSAMLDAVLNFLTLVSPLYSIWNMNLNTKKKFAVSAVLLLGTAELIFTVIRIVILLSVNIQDVPWDFYPIFIWSNVQEAVGIVCICLPALGSLLRYKSMSAIKQSWHVKEGNSNKPIAIGEAVSSKSINDRRSSSVSFGGNIIDRPDDQMTIQMVGIEMTH